MEVLNCCLGRAPESAFNGKKVCVTGGAGFIGRHLVAALTRSGATVVVLDDLSTGKDPAEVPLPEGATLVKGSIADPKKRQEVLDGVAMTFNMAAIASVPKCQADPEGSKQVNREAAVAFLKESPGPVVFCSSAAIYGVPEGIPIAETHPTKPISCYGEDKLAVDVAIRGGACEKGATAMRFFNVYGQGQDPSSPYSGVLSIFAKRAEEDKGVLVLGDGKQTRDFVHVSDVVRALVSVGELLLEKGADAPVAGRAFNVCTGKSVTLLDVLEAMREISGRKLEAEHKPPRDGDIKDSVGTAAELKAAIGWEAQTVLNNGLRDIMPFVK